ncbi:MAG: phosphate ABC transporter permease PstA [Candidatus Tectomicrobia bacterium]|nr:phosphate ABC transporter permease PstA [Candidatus Tectomicrobia bacterium]
MNTKKFWKSGDPFIWLTGGALAFSLLMVGGFILLILVKGLGFFWPLSLLQVTLHDGSTFLGQLIEHEEIPQPGAPPGTPLRYRIQLKTGNRDIYGFDFKWIEEDQIQGRTYSSQAILFERLEWGNLYGVLKEVRRGEEIVGQGEKAWEALQFYLTEARAFYARIKTIEKKEIGQINYTIEQLRLEIRRLELQPRDDRASQRIERLKEEIRAQEALYQTKQHLLAELYQESRRNKAMIQLADGQTKEVLIFQLTRAYRPNTMNLFEKIWFYLVKVWEFISDDPREANTEGGIFPAIFGTVMMVMTMSVAVVPLGVLAALYLREYARQGPLVRAVRIAVNNLAGVPSIVFGVFGLGFFVYLIGGTIDHLFYPEALPTPTFGTGGILWASLTLALLTVPVVIVATEEGLAAVPRAIREGSLALGATKFETIWRIVLPSAMPGILTGLILAMARAAGEVAPLMLTGVVKLAPSLPLDRYWPFLHLERKFMHLGFHIYDVGFQSPNVEAAKPMVYMTTLLLVVVILILNLTAILIRNRLRRKYMSAAF